MFKKTKRILGVVLMVGVLLISSLGLSNVKTEAAYNENPSRLYYDMARMAYEADNSFYVPSAATRNIEDELNGLHAPPNVKKFKVIASVDTTYSAPHPMSALTGGGYSSLQNTGFKAYAVVIEGSNSDGKVFFAFSGTDKGYAQLGDVKTAGVILNGDNPGQLYQAQLFVNYVYEKFDQYQDYRWYFTGHSLGGWLASKVYLDIRSVNWMFPTTSKFKYGGGIGKKKINGVYTFNALPIGKNQMPSIQWTANKDGLYNSDVMNLYIDNEWLNGVKDMNASVIDYVGTEGRVSTGIKHYSYLNYKPLGLYADVPGYYAYSKEYQASINAGHALSKLKSYTQ